MSTKEIYADEARSEGKQGRRLMLILTAILLAVCVLGAAAYFIARNRIARLNTASAPAINGSSGEAPPTETATAAKSWKITGALSETCTCSVPCSCNFGEGPSPHSYCYPFYSYHIRKGNYGDVTLDGLHFGSADLRGGRHMFMDERADERQRAALRIIMARVVERVSNEDSEKKAKEISEEILYARVEQEYDERRNLLRVAGVGEFAADYVMGLDKSQPVVVRNNTTWRIHDSIKAKTSGYKVKIGRDVVDTKATNSNQGEFEYSSDMNFGGAVRWNCGACANRMAHGNDGGDSEPSCNK
ncbi:MAG TPA: DUF1326 domain-containing protein [Pyrinomonadaceae bacterium]|nr:DUF1326 domain-containing protein [Pyrinomonadaceae bacterium]